MKYKTFPLVVVAVALLLSACAATGSHRLKDPSVAATYGAGDSAKNAPADSVTLGQQRTVQDRMQDTWWKGFSDNRLDRMVARVLEVNTDLASAGFRLQKARYSAGLATSDLLPNFDVGGSVGYSKQLSGSSKGQDSYSASASLQYELDLWGRLRTQRSIAQWEAQATDEDLQSTFLALVSDTCDLYWTIAFLNQRIAAGEAS